MLSVFRVTALLLFLSSCATKVTPQMVDLLVKERWVSAEEQLSKRYEQEGITLEVSYETFMTFTPTTVTRTTVCHFKSPVQKTLIVDTQSPMELKGGELKVLAPSFQKQDYNVVLAPKSGKGPNIKRSVYCTASLEEKTYKLHLKNDELILKPVEEILKLKKYKQD